LFIKTLFRKGVNKHVELSFQLNAQFAVYKFVFEVKNSQFPSFSYRL